MKPLKLIISAFGPYKDQVEIDFTKVGNNGIFLIVLLVIVAVSVLFFPKLHDFVVSLTSTVPMHFPFLHRIACVQSRAQRCDTI